MQGFCSYRSREFPGWVKLEREAVHGDSWCPLRVAKATREERHNALVAQDHFLISAPLFNSSDRSLDAVARFLLLIVASPDGEVVCKNGVSDFVGEVAGNGVDIEQEKVGGGNGSLRHAVDEPSRSAEAPVEKNLELPVPQKSVDPAHNLQWNSAVYQGQE